MIENEHVFDDVVSRTDNCFKEMEIKLFLRIKALAQPKNIEGLQTFQYALSIGR